MTGVWNDCLVHVHRSETHHGRHHRSERRFASNREHRHGELSLSEIGLVVDGILSPGFLTWMTDSAASEKMAAECVMK
jgi:hypothetical protein